MPLRLQGLISRSRRNSRPARSRSTSRAPSRPSAPPARNGRPSHETLTRRPSGGRRYTSCRTERGSRTRVAAPKHSETFCDPLLRATRTTGSRELPLDVGHPRQSRSLPPPTPARRHRARRTRSENSGRPTACASAESVLMGALTPCYAPPMSARTLMLCCPPPTTVSNVGTLASAPTLCYSLPMQTTAVPLPTRRPMAQGASPKHRRKWRRRRPKVAPTSAYLTSSTCRCCGSEGQRGMIAVGAALAG